MTKRITKRFIFLLAAITLIFSSPLVFAKKNSVPPSDGETALTMADDSVIYGCYKQRNGQLRVVAGPDECRPSESPISWGQSGQAGDMDLPDTYIGICENTAACYCDDDNVVLHGYAECPPEAFLVSVGTPLDETDYGFHAVCMYLDGTYVDPAYIAIRCLGTSYSENCTDGVDNDEDGFVDCDDLDCADAAECQTPNLEKQPIVTEICSDGIDNDGDGKIDCKDKKDCKKDPSCSKKKKS
jgi:hypothetical protein